MYFLDISQLEKKINDISQKGQNMTHDGHYDSEEILKQIDALVDRFNALQVLIMSIQSGLF